MARQSSDFSVRDTIDRLLETLQELPQVRWQGPVWEPHHNVRGAQVDVEIELEVAGNTHLLLIEVKKAVYPRDVREVLWQFSHMVSDATKSRKGEVVPLLAAESISPGAKDLLKQENVGFYDTGGSLFIPARCAYVYIDRPPPRTLAKPVRALFTGKRSQVLHTLLLSPDAWFGVNELAEIAKASPATVSETLTSLERFEWMSTRGQGPSKQRRLAEPRALLDEWRNQIRAVPPRSTSRRYYVPGISADSLVDRIDQLSEAHHVEYAITQEAAAQRYAPFLSAMHRVTCRMTPGRGANDLVAALEARVVSEGANLEIIESPSPGAYMFKERVGTAWLASPIQVYLDLLRSGGRGQEMAEHLRQERIGF